ncbi:Oxidoreductase FAD/NAD(P)-binding protein [Trichormus variabilis ATCC 29413]|uniref:Oxidoreductase FAD/NAD(P)-binding protein n=3 Tax=Anabaena variabilis TaxID=264691 RepID=Q3M951_TRIV2|nr:MULTISPECIES: ferric reductase-like transmembrane domain-containing protein [Nostocaceae]ABA22485.1 Oxidoreductase FAD/NAD(P)-binding protein [Trichormus variabilis ATCC 29413]MBC1215979.1 ferric reductase-like transmembrane domain-containing protein [Trichormus variabilis ARAD]MBC1256165.1 ferric reductase-like transmembrane domain-containing protein [Trichormus variabilis V5]MBC1267999.1 ferric reductase-like transmembrane domain-containing protein [Trichormus variabilis FSR]MBC1304454.1 
MRSLLMKNPVVIGVSWIAAYIVIILFPLLILLLYPPTPSDERSFLLEFSAALGFIGLAMMAMQFALTARINRVEASYGVDLILQFHRYTSIAAFFFILAHPIILFINNPETLQLLNFFTAPWRARAAVIATLALMAIIITSIWRKQLNIPYEPWRTAHGILAVIIVTFGLGHALGVGNYLGLFWKAVIWSGIAIAALWLLVYVRLVKPYFMQKKLYLVEAVIPQRGNVWNLVLRPRGHTGIHFQPGQFAWLTLGISPFRMREHPFSFASSAEHSDCVEFGIKALGDFTNTIKDVKPGTKAFLDGPYGVFTTDRYENTAGFVLIAGGIGITPIVSMLFTLAERQDERPLLLIYASKTWEDITYREEIEDLKNQLDLTVIHVLKEPLEDWSGERGYVDKKLLERYIPKRPATRNYFICAAPKMMDQVERALHELEVPVTHIHMEHYNLV